MLDIGQEFSWTPIQPIPFLQACVTAAWCWQKIPAHAATINFSARASRWVFMATPPLTNTRHGAAQEPFWNVYTYYYSACWAQNIKWIMMPFQWQYQRKLVAAILGVKPQNVIMSYSKGRAAHPSLSGLALSSGPRPAPRALISAWQAGRGHQPLSPTKKATLLPLICTLHSPLHLPFVSFSPPPLTSAAVTGQ